VSCSRLACSRSSASESSLTYVYDDVTYVYDEFLDLVVCVAHIQHILKSQYPSTISQKPSTFTLYRQQMHYVKALEEHIFKEHIYRQHTHHVKALKEHARAA